MAGDYTMVVGPAFWRSMQDLQRMNNYPPTPDPVEPLSVTLMDNETGEEAVIPPHPDFPHDRYMWENGNYECDCNRLIFWLDAKPSVDDGAEEVDDDEGPPCGSQVTFSCRMVDANGRVVFEDGRYPEGRGDRSIGRG